MKRNRAFVALAAILLLILAGCARATPQIIEKPVEVVVERESLVKRAESGAAYAPAAVADTNLASSEERMIIRTGNLSLTVKDTVKAVEEIKTIVAGMQGVVVSSNTYRVNEQVQAHVTVRVPAESFDAAMAAIKGLATVVEQENTSGQDVTEEYTDLDARLRNLEAAEKELRELLTQVRERTGKAEDIMAVYRELTNIRGQIEQVKGRMQYLGRMTAMATITVQLKPDVVAEPLARRGWRPGATAAEALQRLVRALQFLVDVLIQFVLFLAPILIVVALPLVVLLLLIRWWRRRKATK